MRRPQSSPVLITVSATTSCLVDVRSSLQAALSSSWLPQSDIDGIVLAVDEACSNLIEHAYHNDASQNIDVCVDVRSDEVRVRISDVANAFHPGNVPKPDLSEHIRQRRSGGLGIYLMASMVDAIEYSPSTSKGVPNELILRKRRHP